MSRVRTIGPVVLSAALLAGCGGSSRPLGDGQWYGKLVSVDVAGRRLEFAPACRLIPSMGRWVAAGGSDDYAARADLGQVERIAARGRLPDFSPGWYVAVRRGVVAALAEDSGIRSSGKALRRRLACVWSKRTQAFVK